MDKKKELEKNLNNLNENPDFANIIHTYLVSDVLEIVKEYNLDLPSTIDELKARQNFNNFLSGIIPIEKRHKQ